MGETGISPTCDTGFEKLSLGKADASCVRLHNGRKMAKRFWSTIEREAQHCGVRGRLWVVGKLMDSLRTYERLYRGRATETGSAAAPGSPDS
jgi:hypothetical protein